MLPVSVDPRAMMKVTALQSPFLTSLDVVCSWRSWRMDISSVGAAITAVMLASRAMIDAFILRWWLGLWAEAPVFALML